MMMKSLDRRLHNEKTETLNILLTFNFPGTLFRCFELGNPFYFKHSADENEPGNENDEYYRKELPTGELYLVKMYIKAGPGQSYQIEDTVIRRIK
jgi:hypothetical protein